MQANWVKRKNFVVIITIMVCILALMCNQTQAAEHAVKGEGLLGDMNADMVVDSEDLLLLTKYLAEYPLEMTEQGLKNADLNEDGIIDGRDLLRLARQLENVEEPIEEENKQGDVLKVGDYVEYIPTATTYTVLSSTTNYKTGKQTFNPSEATKWRVLSNDEINGVQLITDGSVGNLTLKGNIGFNNIVKTLNELNKAYENNDYTVSRPALGATRDSIEINKSGTFYAQSITANTNDANYMTDLELMKKASIEETGESYWLASREHDRSKSTKSWSGRIITADGELSASPLHKATSSSSSTGSTVTHGVRPVVKLLEGMVVVGGKGTAEAPYKIELGEEGKREAEYKNILINNKADKGQIAIIRNGELVETYENNCDEDEKFEVFALSKTILGIIAAKMDEEGVLDLDERIDAYWYSLKDMDFSTSSKEWQAFIKDEARVKKNAKEKMVENPATLRNFLTHSSTIKNAYMMYENSVKHTGEFIGGSIGKSFSMATFMLKHTAGQLFYKGTPGTTTEYDPNGDVLTREHSVAGYTMMVAARVSVDEYLKEKILIPLGITETEPGFKRTVKDNETNSMYYAAGYQSSAKDFAKVIALLANDGVYDGKQILSKDTINEIEKVEENLKNQTIAFNYIDGKLERNGRFTGNVGFSQNKLNQTGWHSYVSYDPITGDGFVVTAYGVKCNMNNIVSELKNKVY